jgi:hypothetical protein
MDSPSDLLAGLYDDEHKTQRAHKIVPYGKACLNCVRNKTRCGGFSERHECERYVSIPFLS